MSAPTYAPGPVPADPAALQRYLQDEFRKINVTFRNITDGHRDVLYAEPAKPRAGQIVYADGTTWNPGSGEGYYRYSLAGTWVSLG